MNNQIGHWVLEDDGSHWFVLQNGTGNCIIIRKDDYREWNIENNEKVLKELVNQANTASSKSSACARAYIKALERKIWRQGFCIRKWREEAEKRPRVITLGLKDTIKQSIKAMFYGI